MEPAEIERLAAIGVGRRWVSDPAFDRDDLMQIARITVWRKQDRHPGRIVLAVRDAMRRVRMSAQVRMRQRQETLGVKYQVESRKESEQNESGIKCEQLASRLERLSKRQREVMELSCKGLTSVEIARQLNALPSSIRNSRSAAMKLLKE